MKTLDDVRDLRNKVIHGWGHKHVPETTLRSFFSDLSEPLQPHYPNEDDFYDQAAFNFVRLYSRTQPLKTQLSLILEREAIKQERASRGYP